jgi:hypothetical protein
VAQTLDIEKQGLHIIRRNREHTVFDEDLDSSYFVYLGLVITSISTAIVA